MPRVPTPDDDAPDTGAAAQQQVRRTPAGAAPLPAPPGTRRSAFDTVPAPAPSGPVIHRQKPIPEPRTGKASVYLQVYEGMEVGDCAEYPDRAAKSMVSILKKRGLPHLVRRLTPTTLGVWRVAGVVAGVNLSTTKRKAA